MSAKIFDVAGGREIVSYPGHDNVVIATAISPDGRWAASGGGSNNEIHLWDLRPGVRIGERLLGADGQPLNLADRDGRFGRWASRRMGKASHGEMIGKSTIRRGGL